MRIGFVVTGLLLVLASGCNTGKVQPTPSAQPGSASPAPSPPPSPSPSISPSATSSPTKKPTGPPNTPPPPANNIGPGGSVVRTGTDQVALTFDDGPDPDYTPRMLDLLQRERVKATFCVLGKRAVNNAHLIRRIHDEGHTLCNHTWSHDLALASKTEAQIRDELQATNNAIREAVPDAQISYFRAPGGHFDARLIAIAKSMGMTSIYWHVDTRDWETKKYPAGQKMVNNIVSRVQGSTRKGSIVLAHDIRQDTITAFDYLLRWLKQRFTLIALPPNGVLA